MNQFAHKNLSRIFNKTFIHSLAVIFIFTTQIVHAQTCAPAPVGLVSWFSGDTNALDSRSRNNGTLGASSQFAAGQVGQAFQTTSATGSTVTAVAESPNTPPLDFTNAFTIEMWVSPAQVGANNGTSFLACKGSCGSASGFSYALVLNNNGSEVFFRVGNGATFAALPSSPLPLNTFTHLAATYDGTTMRIYLNGVLNASMATAIGTLLDSSQPLRIGGSDAGNTLGIYDEVSLYNRVLSASEIQTIANAGTAGKCNPTATVAPSGLVAWFAGDGNANDIAGTNNGTLQNGASHTVGKVGQGFLFDGIDEQVVVGNVSSLDVQTGDFTIEAWANAAQNKFHFIAGKDSCGDPNIYSLNINQLDAPGFRVNNSTGNSFIALASAVSLNEWHHIVGVKEAGNIKIFVDGVLQNTLPISGSFAANGNNFSIGNRINSNPTGCGNNNFAGRIDEVSLYNRALTGAEITSIFNAGIAGKLKTATTPIGFALSEPSAEADGLTSPFGIFSTISSVRLQPSATADGSDISPQVVSTTVGDATVTFPTVLTAGTTQQIPLDLSLFPSLPTGSASTGLTYDIATAATYTGSPQVCFNLPSVTTSTAFGNLRILHLESNTWTNRTNLASINFATKTICTDGLASLSPFAVVNGFASAANASISGQVTTANGNGIRNIAIQLTNSETGATIFAYTGSFGFYKFENVETGRTYILNASAKKYQFNNPSRVINLNQDLTDEDFIGAVK